MREEFEKLPGIARIIKENSAFYCKEEECYVCPDDDQFAESYLGGALYAYQEQQKIINMQECGATEIQMILDDNEYDDANKLERIKELLK